MSERTASESTEVGSGTGLVLPRAWPFWSESAHRRVHEHLVGAHPFRSWPSDPIAELEEGMARRHGAEHAVYVNSGTSALFAAYFGLGLRAGDEVLVPTNTFLATVTPLFLLNLVPVLCDADPITGNIDLRDAERRVTVRTAAIAVTHLWGTPIDGTLLQAFAHRHGLALVEDCSHAHGTSAGGRMVGGSADAAAFSLGAAKTVTGGVGGVVLTSRRDVYERVLLLGQPAKRTGPEMTLPQHAGLAATGLGANMRGNPLSALLAGDHLARLDEIIRAKQATVTALEAILESARLVAPPAHPDHWTGGTRYGFKAAMRSGDAAERDEVVAELRAAGLPVSGAPGPLLHRRRVFAEQSALTGYAPGREVTTDPDDYPAADAIQSAMVSVDATLLHEPAPRLLERFTEVLTEVEARRPVWSPSAPPRQGRGPHRHELRALGVHRDEGLLSVAGRIEELLELKVTPDAAVVGIGAAGLLLASTWCALTGADLTLVRHTVKAHGLRQRVDGHWRAGRPAVVLCSPGDIGVLDELGAEIADVVLFDDAAPFDPAKVPAGLGPPPLMALPALHAAVSCLIGDFVVQSGAKVDRYFDTLGAAFRYDVALAVATRLFEDLDRTGSACGIAHGGALLASVAALSVGQVGTLLDTRAPAPRRRMGPTVFLDDYILTGADMERATAALADPCAVESRKVSVYGLTPRVVLPVGSATVLAPLEPPPPRRPDR